MIPRFFKDMPKNKNEKGRWVLLVFTIFPLKTNVSSKTIYDGRLWVAYVKVRMQALIKSWQTAGEEYGIGWSVVKADKQAKSTNTERGG